MPYLLDGYNVYHAATKLDPAWQQLTPINLCRLVAADMQHLADQGVIVFDGRPLRGQPMDVEPEGCLRLIYSGPQHDADTEIAHLIAKNSAPRRLTVVSSDRQVRKTARRRRCPTLEARDYLIALQARAAEPPPPPPTEPPEKHTGLQNGDIDQWLQLFGLDDLDPPDPTDRTRL